MTDSIWSVMGVYGVTVVILLWIIRWLIGELAKKDDKLMEMLPALTQVQETLGNITKIATDLLTTIAVLRDQDRQDRRG